MCDLISALDTESMALKVERIEDEKREKGPDATILPTALSDAWLIKISQISNLDKL